MYRAYTTFITRLSPFVWSHRLEFPIAAGILCCMIAVLLGNLIDLSSVEYGAGGENLVLFIIIAFFMVLVILVWLTQVSGTISLPNSLSASRYPILTIVAAGTIVLSMPPYIVSNLVAITYDQTPNWPLFSDQERWLWDRFGVFWGLTFISIVSAFTILLRRIGAQKAILSTFVSAAFGFMAFFVAVVISESSDNSLEFVGLIFMVLVWTVIVIVNVLFYKGWLFSFHDIWSGVSLFVVSFLPVWLGYQCVFLVGGSFDLGVQIRCFGLSLLLSEIVIAIMRRKRYLAI